MKTNQERADPTDFVRAIIGEGSTANYQRGQAYDDNELVDILPRILREGMNRIEEGEAFVLYAQMNVQRGFDYVSCMAEKKFGKDAPRPYQKVSPEEYFYRHFKKTSTPEEEKTSSGQDLREFFRTTPGISDGGGGQAPDADWVIRNLTEDVSSGTICFKTERLMPSQGIAFVVESFGDRGYTFAFYHPTEMIPVTDGTSISIPESWRTKDTR
jgi:hypothetical protein